MKSSTVKYEDFVVLYRMNMQSRAIEDALRQYNIPYKIRSGQSFYQRAEVKDVLAFFRIACNPKDIEAFERVLKLTDKIGATSIEKLYLLSNNNNLSIFEVMQDTKLLSTMFNQNTAIRLKNIADCVAAWHSRVKTTDAFELAGDILHISRIEQKLKDEGDSESEVRLQNIDALMSALKLFTVSEHQIMDEETGEIIIADDSLRTLDEFVQTVVLLTSEDEEDEKGEKVDVVTLMTIHAAKGLEYPYVFIAGVEENIFPSLKSINTKDELEEERRLFYVAITRAMKNLFISFAKTRYLHGQFSFCEPSRFLEELDMDTLDKPNLLKEDNEDREQPKTSYSRFSQDFNKNFNKTPQKEVSKPVERGFDNFKSLSNFKNIENKNATTFVAGMKVKHDKFGLGEVLEVTQNDRISVRFDEVGIKTLLLAFAKLEVL
jgi:DNA helicase-2/ATP-dependent DNA helicase PcrA